MYIISDLKNFRTVQGDDTLGGMVICETSEQARKIFAFFDEVQHELNSNSSQQSHFKAGLILHDNDDKDTRKQIVKDFKKNMTTDILIVFNMLLTGFDAPRLKRLYFGRKLDEVLKSYQSFRKEIRCLCVNTVMMLNLQEFIRE